MDSVARQTGQHVEFEAEWEAAFNLHCKLAPVLTLIVQWCASDRRVLLKSTRYYFGSSFFKYTLLIPKLF